MKKQTKAKTSRSKHQARKVAPQPEPFTPSLTKGMIRQHAFTLYRDKLHDEGLTLEDWVLAEKDLLQTMEADGLLKR